MCPINFDALPQDKPEGMGFSLVPTGFRKMEIVKTEVKESKNNPGSYYINAQLKDEETGAILYEIITESDSPAMMYKMSRLIQACKMPLTGSLELEDLAKLLKGRKLVVDVKHEKDDYQTKKQGKDVDKAVVNAFENDVYYTYESYASLVPNASEPTPAEAEQNAASDTPNTY